MMENKKPLYCPYCAEELTEEIETSSFYCPYADCPKNIDYVFEARMAVDRLSDFEIEEMMRTSVKEQHYENNSELFNKAVLLAIDTFLIYWYFSVILPENLDDLLFLIIISIILLFFSIYCIFTFLKKLHEFQDTRQLIKSSQEKYIQKKAEYEKQKFILKKFNKLKNRFNEKDL